MATRRDWAHDWLLYMSGVVTGLWMLIVIVAVVSGRVDG